jgi:hypothetical protein
MGLETQAQTPPDGAVALTPTLVKWLIAAHLSAISAWFFAFGAALLIDQSEDAAITDAVRREISNGSDADALLLEIGKESTETAINFLPVGAFGWLVFAVGAFALILPLFLTTGLFKGFKQNLSSYKFIVIGLLAAGSAFVVATISNVMLTLAGTVAPWLFLVPAVIALVGYVFLSAGLVSALWGYARKAMRRRRAGHNRVRPGHAE